MWLPLVFVVAAQGASPTAPSKPPAPSPEAPPAEPPTEALDAREAARPDAPNVGIETCAEPEPAEPQPERALRVAVQDLEVAGVDPHWGRVVTDNIVAELRKHARVQVLGTRELRAMLDFEAEKQALGCDTGSCLTEVVEALGVSDLVIGGLAEVGEEHVFSLRRVNVQSARVVDAVDRRFAIGNGEEFLVAIGPAVRKLFPELQLRAGQTRGVPKQVSAMLNPPPLDPWVFYSGAAGVGALSVLTASLVSGNAISLRQFNQLNKTVGRAQDEVVALGDLADSYAAAAWTTGAITVAGAGALGVAALFTDWRGARAQLEVE